MLFRKLYISRTLSTGNHMSITAMKQALEALEHEANIGNDNAYQRERDALRTAIAEAEKEPAQREWVGFTEDEINEYDYEYRDFIYDIEALLKHKNTRLG
jgi:hypothetical protein